MQHDNFQFLDCDAHKVTRIDTTLGRSEDGVIDAGDGHSTSVGCGCAYYLQAQSISRLHKDGRNWRSG
jgi:hypothetical protein